MNRLTSLGTDTANPEYHKENEGLYNFFFKNKINLDYMYQDGLEHD